MNLCPVVSPGLTSGLLCFSCNSQNMNELLVQFIPGALGCRKPHYPSLPDAPHQSVPTSLMVYNLQLLFWYKFLAWQKSGCPEQELVQVSLKNRGLLWIFTQQNCRSGKVVRLSLAISGVTGSTLLCLSVPLCFLGPHSVIL